MRNKLIHILYSKRIVSLFFLSGAVFFYTCGSNNTDIEKQEDAKLDAIRIDDSIAASIKKAKFYEDSAEKEKARRDSLKGKEKIQPLKK